MTRRQYLTIMGALAGLLIAWLLAMGVYAFSQKASCNRGNVTRAHLVSRVPPADCGLIDVVLG